MKKEISEAIGALKVARRILANVQATFIEAALTSDAFHDLPARMASAEVLIQKLINDASKERGRCFARFVRAGGKDHVR